MARRFLFVLFLWALIALPFLLLPVVIAYGETSPRASHEEEIFVPVKPANYGSDFDRLPERIREAVKSSQGEVQVAMLTWGGSETRKANGVLVGARHVLVPARIIPEYPELAYGESTVYAFNGIPSKFVFGDLETGLAILEIERDIPGMRPADIADGVVLQKKYEGLMFLDLRYGKAVAASMVLETLEGGMFSPDRLPGNNVSGTPLWDPDTGKMVGVLVVSPQETGVISWNLIRDFLERFNRWLEDRKGQGSGRGGQAPKVRIPAGLSPQDASLIARQSSVFAEILSFYATQSLSKPDNLVACAQEMLRMKPDEKSCRDQYSVYIPKEEYELGVAPELEGKFGGIGVEIGVRDGKVVVISPREGGPAFRAGVLPGDQILAVDGIPIKDISDAVRRIRGKVGTPVKVTFGREGSSLVLEIVREEIAIRAVEYRIIDGIGYLKVKTFSTVTPDEFRDALANLRSRGVSRVVIDLRYNPGGSLLETLEMLYEFAKAGDILITMRERDTERVFDTNSTRVALRSYKNFGNRTPGTFRDMKIAVLINGGSASASEIFAGTMKDWGYPVVGSKSFGKGVGQTVFPLSDGSTLKLTTFEFLVGNGRVKVHGLGVTPTHPVSDPKLSSSDTLRDDKQLEKAMEVLSR